MNTRTSATGRPPADERDKALPRHACPWLQAVPPTLPGPAPAEEGPLPARLRRSFARALREWRQQRGLTRSQVAAALGFSVSTISAWEGGRRLPDNSQADLLMVYTGLPPCQLFCTRTDECLLSKYAQHRDAWNDLCCSA